MEAFIGALPRIRLGRVSVETQRYRSQVKFETNFSHPFKNSTTFIIGNPEHAHLNRLVSRVIDFLSQSEADRRTFRIRGEKVSKNDLLELKVLSF